jgi:hypothetical protein
MAVPLTGEGDYPKKLGRGYERNLDADRLQPGVGTCLRGSQAGLAPKGPKRC